MEFQDLFYDYPEHLVARAPKQPPRVLWNQNGESQEIPFADLLEKIPAGDLLVVNDTQVLKRRVFANDLEILFLSSHSDRTEWDVLFPSKNFALKAEIPLPENRKMTLIAKGRPQKVKTDQPLTESYFEKVAELPLPPYIQKARGERHNVQDDQKWYQTAWAQNPGSLAAPTASLHFNSEQMEKLKARGVLVEKITLHVGLGTFLPLSADVLEKGVLHKEFVHISGETWQQIQNVKARGGKVWALGTTVTRSLESAAHGFLQNLSGETDLFIRPGFEFKIVDRLMTNFHQPGSSLLALVMAFSGMDSVKKAYKLAVEKEMRLFSYGDFSVWLK